MVLGCMFKGWTNRRLLAVLGRWLLTGLACSVLFSAAAAGADRLLVHVDVETTGLEAGYHELIDAGVIVTTIDGDIVDRLFLRIMPDHPERLDPRAAAVNGFSMSRWRSLEAVEGASALNAFLLRYSADHQLIFTAFNVGFYHALFEVAQSRFQHFFHYMVLDLPFMAWALGARSLSMGARCQILIR